MLSQGHQRRPLEGFSGCPSVTQILMNLGLSEKSLLSTEGVSSHDDGLSELHLWNAPSVFGLEDLIASSSYKVCVFTLILFLVESGYALWRSLYS